MFQRARIPAFAIAFVSNWLFFLVWLIRQTIWILSANFPEKSLCPDLLSRLALIVLAADKSLFLVHFLPKIATGNPLSLYSTRSVLFPADDSSYSAFDPQNPNQFNQSKFPKALLSPRFSQLVANGWRYDKWRISWYLTFNEHICLCANIGFNYASKPAICYSVCYH